jgi:5,10-methylene-tetrahydrofolate dehydrogenase/methenyl tetrahydrofolate cyclohydrolase
MSKHLVVYYDNPTEPSDMYLKMIKKDAEEKGVEVYVCTTLDEAWNKSANDLLEEDYIPLLVLQPTKNPNYLKLTDKREYFDFVDVDGDSYDSATATGIYNHIVGLDPSRETTVGVIGRGLVGKQLIDMLIDYGYTVVELNSKTKGVVFENLLTHCDIIVGLSSVDNIIDEDQKDMIEFYGEKTWIDAGHNFNFDDRKSVLKCGKWTREVLFNRIAEI